MKQIFPKEILENTTQVHRFKHTSQSKFIYAMVLLFFLASISVLPFLKVTLYSNARGILKPNKERVVLSVLHSGHVTLNNTVNNGKVALGDTLMVIDNNGIDEQLEFSNYQLQENAKSIKDLSLMLEQKPLKTKLLSSVKYQRVYAEYIQQSSERRTQFKKTAMDFDRHKTLYDKNVISKSEFEDKKFDHDMALLEIQQFNKQQYSVWQADLTQYQMQQEELKSQVERLHKNKAQFVVTAPVTGTLLNGLPQELGSAIVAGTKLGEISPDTDLLVECYVSPVDIGLLQENTKTNFQIDAYNYNQWGFATGKITEIGKDMELIDNQPIFKVRCTLDQDYLQLKNGFKGSLKKGMTLTVNFELTERSLYELLYDKMDDWLNPIAENMAKATN